MASRAVSKQSSASPMRPSLMSTNAAHHVELVALFQADAIDPVNALEDRLHFLGLALFDSQGRDAAVVRGQNFFQQLLLC